MPVAPPSSEPATARAFLHKILLDLAQCPHAQPALADHTHLLDAMATEIATCCDGGGGEEGLEERLFLAYVLAELADPYPTAVLERVGGASAMTCGFVYLV